MSTHQDKCAICNNTVHTYDYDYGYDFHSENHQTVKPYQQRQISIPEKKDTIYVDVCQECIDKEPSLKSLIFRFRKEALESDIDGINHDIKNSRLKIEELKKEIPKLKEKNKKLIKKLEDLK